MDIIKLSGLLLVFSITINHSKSSPSSIHTISVAKEKYRRHDSLSDQGLHGTLLNIDDKLRIVESIRYSMNRWEISLDRMSNKIDSVESRTLRMQTILQMKLESLSQAVMSSELKHERLLDQFRKYETNQDRINLKISSLETKFDDFIRKMQTNQDSFFEKIDNKQTELHNKIKDIGTEATNIKLHSVGMENKINSTNKELLLNLKNIENKIGKNEHFENLTKRLDGIHNHLNQSDSMWTQNDGPRTIDKEKMIDSFKVELNSEAQKIGNKVNNMYLEIWKKIANVETLVKDGFVGSNVTQKIMQDDLQSLVQEQRESERFIDITVEKVLSIMQDKFNNHQDKIDHNFHNIEMLQNMFLDNCRRIQEDGMSLESKVSKLLEKLLDVFFNSTLKIEKTTLDLLELLKSHNSHVVQLTNQNARLVRSLAEDMNQDHKKLHVSIMDVAEYAENSFATVQELQDQLLEFNDTIARTIPVLVPTVGKYLSMILNVQKLNTTEKEIKETTKNEEPIHAVEANYNEGVIKILTDIPSAHTNPKSVENSEDTNQDISMNTKLKFEELLSSLNKSINTTGINAIIATPNKNKTKYDVGGTKFKTNPPQNTYVKKSDDSPEITDEIATQLMLSYIRLIKHKITVQDFLNENLTGKRYNSISDMIQHLKPIQTIPREFIRELDQYETRLSFEKRVSNGHIKPDYFTEEEEAFNYEDIYSDVT